MSYSANSWRGDLAGRRDGRPENNDIPRRPIAGANSGYRYQYRPRNLSSESDSSSRPHASYNTYNVGSGSSSARQTPPPSQLRPPYPSSQARSSPSPAPSSTPRRTKHVHFADEQDPPSRGPSQQSVHPGDEYLPSEIIVTLRLGPPERPTMDIKISIIFEAGRIPRIRVTSKKPRVVRRAERAARARDRAGNWY